MAESGAEIRPSKPIMPVPEINLRYVAKHFDITEGVYVVGVRGWTAADDRTGVYDDAISIVTPKECKTFLGNTEPSRTLEGRASLVPNEKYRYTRGIHGISRPKSEQRLAWIQNGPVKIQRYAEDQHTLGPVLDGQWVGLNIHDGSWTTTGSAGCQTIVPESWKAFDTMLLDALQASAQAHFWYVLIDERTFA